MSDFLSKIITSRLLRVQEAEAKIGFPEVKRLAAEAVSRRDVRKFIPRPETEIGIIAEIKRASPAAGVIARDVDVERLAGEYTRGGAAAISVLTEPDFFAGSPETLIAARRVSAVPVLRKDFVVAEYQIYESAVMGADMVLLIARLLEAGQLAEYAALTRELGMEPLVEIFCPEDAEKLTGCNARLVGINNRDLKTFAVNPKRALEMVKYAEAGATPIIASAIKTPEDVRFYTEQGVNHFLIGESLMRSADPEAELRKFAS